METLAAAGRLDPLDGDMLAITPGLTARHLPGHTLGHYGLVVSSGDDRAVLFGDAVECPLQLEEPDFYALSDVDPSLAARTREACGESSKAATPPSPPRISRGCSSAGCLLAARGRRLFAPLT